MKKIAFFAALACGVLLGFSAQSQNVRFGKYFEDATLRLDYHRVGNRQHNAVRDFAPIRYEAWAGSTTQLIDPFDNGDFRVVVCDAKSGKELYSRCYNSLFQEYRDTPKGKDSVAQFEEVLRLPWPKKAVEIRFEERGEDQQFGVQHVYCFDPAAVLNDQRLRPSPKAETRAVKLLYSGKSHSKCDIVIVPEGYGPGDSVRMMADLQKFCEYTLGQEPFASRRKDFNVWGIARLGESGGITDPTKGISVNSLVGSSYNTFACDRYLMTQCLYRLHDVVGSTPCDHIVIMANCDTYGGGAIYNFYAMSSINKMAYMVLPHELGHSIGGLADEYVDEDLSYGETYPLTLEPTEPNITTLVSFEQKWKDMLPEGTPVPTPDDKYVYPGENGKMGVFEGGGYRSKGIYRPVMHCMMRDYAPFCPVCSKRLNEVFDLYTR